jgi:hypothetical protein
MKKRRKWTKQVGQLRSLGADLIAASRRLQTTDNRKVSDEANVFWRPWRMFIVGPGTGPTRSWGLTSRPLGMPNCPRLGGLT